MSRYRRVNKPLGNQRFNRNQKFEFPGDDSRGFERSRKGLVISRSMLRGRNTRAIVAACNLPVTVSCGSRMPGSRRVAENTR
jgi:hypothetical protein